MSKHRFIGDTGGARDRRGNLAARPAPAVEPEIELIDDADNSGQKSFTFGEGIDAL